MFLAVLIVHRSRQKRIPDLLISLVLVIIKKVYKIWRKGTPIVRNSAIPQLFLQAIPKAEYWYEMSFFCWHWDGIPVPKYCNDDVS